MRDDGRDELDKLIDAALREYSSAGPMDGLEVRVLRRVEAGRGARRRGWMFRLAIAAPALAAILVVASSLGVKRPPPVKAPASATAGIKPPAALEITAQAAPPRIRRAARRLSARQKPLPRLERFPTPAPLTAEEHALLAWTRSAPEQARQTFADMRTRAEEPVTVPPIRIPPLQSDGNP